MTNQGSTDFLITEGTDRLAYRHIKPVPGTGQAPCLLWLGGFLSDMSSTKVTALAAHAEAAGWEFLTLDYFAHGLSEGSWNDARLGRWRANVAAVADIVTASPLIVIGSSMGAWLTALLLKDRPQRVKAIGLIAPAPDFTHELMLPGLSPEDRRALTVAGAIDLPGFDRPVSLTQAFFDEAARHLVLGSRIDFDGPVRVLQGMKDETVPWQHAVRMAEAFSSRDVVISLIKNGDHRLSTPSDIVRLIDMATELREAVMTLTGK